MTGPRPPLHLAALLNAAGWRGRVIGPSVVAGSGPEADPHAPGDVVRLLARTGRQQDGMTCGSAVLTMLAAAGDPALAAWLASGVLPDSGPRPPELTGAPQSALTRLAGAAPTVRARTVHRVLQRRTTRAGLPWPAVLGTSPWGAARVARFPGVRWTHHPLGGEESVRAHLERVAAWVERGIPVPLYSGGDLRQGAAAAVPRHVVLVTGHRRGVLDVWEPAQGAVVRVPVDRLVRTAGRTPALGGWSRVVWALAPWRVAGPGVRMGAVPVPSERS